MGFNKKFLSRQEAADALGISLVTLARRLRDQSIPYVKIAPESSFQQLSSISSSRKLSLTGRCVYEVRGQEKARG